MDLDIPRILMQMVILFFSVSFHETAHGFVAEKVGDPTARMLGRITLNPVKHLDLWGSVLIPVFLAITGLPIFGWAKPVPVTRENFRHPRRDEILVSFAGPGSNFLLCAVATLLLWISARSGMFTAESGIPLLLFLTYFLIVNLVLGIFNLIPLPPLDGSWILRAIIPAPWAYKVSLLERYGMLFIFLMIAFGFTTIVFRPFFHLARFALGALGIPVIF